MDNQTTNQPVKITTIAKDFVKVVNETAQGDGTGIPLSPHIITYASVIPQPPKEEVKDLGHNKLLPALYFIFDAFSRGQAQFFLVRQTAKDAIATKQLTGDHIDIGVRKLEWENGNSELVLPFLEQEHVEIIKQEPNFITFAWQDVPFTMHLYDDNPCVTALIPLAYEYETWNIPNQFDRFCTEFDK